MPSVKQLRRNTIAMLMSRRRKTEATNSTLCSTDDDDSSTTSTISANRAPMHKTLLDDTDDAATTTPTSTLNPKKGVSFNEYRNESHDNTILCKEDTAELWYNNKDLSRFKLENNDLVKEIIRNERHIQAVNSYQRVLQRVYNACLQQPQECCDNGSSSSPSLSPNDSLCLPKLLSGDDRIGLERKTVRSITKDGHFRRKDIYKMILDIQGMKTTTTIGDDRSELLRHSCQALSRPLRLFAHELAVAQAAATISA